MPKSRTASAASFVLAAAIVLATWLPTVSTPSADFLTAGTPAQAHRILA